MQNVNGGTTPAGRPRFLKSGETQPRPTVPRPRYAATRLDRLKLWQVIYRDQYHVPPQYPKDRRLE
jgi:hypothetical protein